MGGSQDPGDESDASTAVFDSSLDNDFDEDESLGLNLDYTTTR